MSLLNFLNKQHLAPKSSAGKDPRLHSSLTTILCQVYKWKFWIMIPSIYNGFCLIVWLNVLVFV